MAKRRERKRDSPKANQDARIYRMLRARFDAALSSNENRRHWQYADGASADAAASSEVRATLRNRSRYEVANNSFAKGIAQTLANYTIGTGPRLQMLSSNNEVNRQIERDFQDWARAVGFAEKLRTMRLARVTDGEAFLAMVANPRIAHSIDLDLRLLETDQICSAIGVNDKNDIDGVRLDVYGNPISYRVLRRHPGNDECLEDKADIIPAELMAHYFRTERPGQHRGLPDITPCLPLFALLRRYTLAVIMAAESAANFAGVLYTDAPAGGEADVVDPMDTVELERNMLLTMPAGWKLGQLKAEQPSATYPTFTEKILNEIARGMGVPYGIAIGNSAGFNYASGRLDYQSFFKLISIEQGFIEERVLDPVLRYWLLLYLYDNSDLLRVIPAGSTPPHQWFWDGVEHVDPAKEATAQQTRLNNNTTTLAIEYARQGRDWEEQLRQRAKEKALINELGLDTAQENSQVMEEDDG